MQNLVIPVIGRPEGLPITDEYADQIKSSHKTISAIYNIEMKFDLLKGNYFDLQKDLLDKALIHSLYQGAVFDHLSKDERDLTRKFFNFLSTAKFYIDQVCRILGDVDKNISDKIKTYIETKRKNNLPENFTIRLMIALRNHMQHYDFSTGIYEGSDSVILGDNEVAHQDYTMGARIEVVEFENEKLVFKNAGTFIPNSINEVLASDSPESVYRNPFLVEAMRNLGMIETQGGGIKKLHILQMRRGFSLPQYNFDNMYVKLTISGIQTNKRVPPEKIEELERTDSFDEYAEYYTKDVIEKTAIENIPQTVEMEKTTLQTTLENDTTTLETTSEKIILLIRENPKITRDELASACKISVDGIKWQLKKLKGKVLHTGPNKGGRWEIIGE